MVKFINNLRKITIEPFDFRIKQTLVFIIKKTIKDY